MSDRFRRPGTAAPAAPDVAAAPTAESAALPAISEQPSSSEASLQARRNRLARGLAEAQWDLGGLTYEMAIRDHFRLDVLVRKAAELQAIDAELGETERILALREGGATGTCPTCGAMHSRMASFCWQCGSPLLPADHAEITEPAR